MDISQAQIDVVNGFNTEAAWLELIGLERTHQLSSLHPRKEMPPFNGHAHTTESFNPLGWSPLGAVLHAKLNGWLGIGTAEFDTATGAKSVRAAGHLLGLPTFNTVETRVFIPWVDKGVEVNSPGEPQIAYHAFVGFPTRRSLPEDVRKFLSNLLDIAKCRNESIIRAIHDDRGMALNMPQHARPLTPHGNITERHLCTAYANIARGMIGDDGELRKYWAEKLRVGVEEIDLETPFALELLIRDKLMKAGGPGYITPTRTMFPELSEMNRVALLCGAIPAVMWLNGVKGAEADAERFLDWHVEDGVRAVCVIPERNQGDKLVHLETLVKAATERGLILLAGTELNKPGQWEDVHCEEQNGLLRLRDEFETGFFAAYGHQVLLDWCGLGYNSDWAEQNFPDLPKRKAFFAQVGKAVDPAHEEKLASLSAATPVSEFPGA